MLRSDLIKNQKASRGGTQGFLLNFLVNFSQPAKLMHAMIPLLKGRHDLFQTAMRSYLIGMAACLETFYRDLYICVLDEDPKLLRSSLGQIKEKASLEEIHQLTVDGISFAELSASKAAFQNIDEIDRFLSTLFSHNGYLETLSEYDFVCAIPSRNTKQAHMKLHTAWRGDFARIFQLRHEFAHDANSKTSLDPVELQRLEACALLIPQMTAALIASNRSLKIVKSGTLPVLLTVDDLISDDWEVVEDESGGGGLSYGALDKGSESASRS